MIQSLFIMLAECLDKAISQIIISIKIITLFHIYINKSHAETCILLILFNFNSQFNNDNKSDNIFINSFNICIKQFSFIYI